MVQYADGNAGSCAAAQGDPGLDQAFPEEAATEIERGGRKGEGEFASLDPTSPS